MGNKIIKMRITNTSIGNILVFILSLLLHHYLWGYWSADCVDEGEYNSGVLVAAHSGVICFWVVLVTGLYSGGIKFSLYIPSPLEGFQKTLLARRELNTSILRRLQHMAHLEGDCLVKKQREIDILEERLSKLNLVNWGWKKSKK